MKFSLNKTILPFLLILYFTLQLPAQVSIEGLVTFSILDLPLPGSEIQILTEDGVVDTTVVSDLSGKFEYKANLAEGEIVVFQYTDICFGDVLSVSVPVEDLHVKVHIRQCIRDQEICAAQFVWHPIDDQSIQFLDLSHPEVLAWNWDFGDGTTSAEQNPVHQYDHPGIYIVTLEILGLDSCESSISQEVWVDTFPCLCPEYAFPVCVLTESGEKITFDNPCFAACEGYDVFVACEDTCGCDSSYAPICIQAPFGAITFQNLCEAACAGFTAADTCRPICVCPDIWDPVCVDLPDGTVLQFSNDCEAQCEGYTDYYPCNPDSCICPAIYDPVCAINSDGEILTFSNECEANCAGYFWTFPCDSSCICDTVYDPVCILLPRLGWIVEIRNRCLAEKHGLSNEIFSPDSVSTHTGKAYSGQRHGNVSTHTS